MTLTMDYSRRPQVWTGTLMTNESTPLYRTMNASRSNALIFRLMDRRLASYDTELEWDIACWDLETSEETLIPTSQEEMGRLVL